MRPYVADCRISNPTSYPTSKSKKDTSGGPSLGDGRKAFKASWYVVRCGFGDLLGSGTRRVAGRHPTVKESA